VEQYFPTVSTYSKATDMSWQDRN